MVFKRKISDKEISVFVSEAGEKSSYSSAGLVKQTKLPDGTRVIGPYTNGELTYIDIYKGFESFEGVEKVLLNKKIIWKRNYIGGLIDKTQKSKTEMAKLYEFLKMALRNCPKDKPFRRGPDRFKHGDYEYTDTCSGNLGSFKGNEKILYKGKEIYALTYDGGYN
jgi:hypothetical protein